MSGTIALASGLPSVQHTLEIDGTGQTITVDGGGASRVFLNFSGALTLNNLTVANGQTTSNGGGVFNNGILTVTDSTFVGNSTTPPAAPSTMEPRHAVRYQLHLFRQCSAAGGGDRQRSRRDRDQQHVLEQQCRDFRRRRGGAGRQHHASGYELDSGEQHRAQLRRAERWRRSATAATISPTMVRAASGAPLGANGDTIGDNVNAVAGDRRAAEQRRVDRHDRVAGDQPGGQRSSDCRLPADRSARRSAPRPGR